MDSNEFLIRDYFKDWTRHTALVTLAVLDGYLHVAQVCLHHKVLAVPVNVAFSCLQEADPENQ